MATRTVTHITDDLDGSTEGVETVTFALHGATYEVDLSKENQSKLEETLEPFLNVARKAGGSSGRRSSTRSTSTGSGSSSSSGSGVDAKAVRVWAAENKIEVPARGRIPGSVIEKYQAAQN